MADAPVSAEDAARRARLRRIEGEVTRLEKERDRLASDERGLLGRLDRLAAEARLLDARMEELDLLSLETRQAVVALEGDQRQAEEQLAAARKRFKATVRMLQRIGPIGRLRPVLDAPDAERLAAGLRLSHELTRRQRDQVAEIDERLAELERIRGEREAREEELSGLRQRTRSARRKLTDTIRSRRRLLGSIRSEKATREQALAELDRARDELAAIVAGRAAPHEVAIDVLQFKGLWPMPAEGRVSQAFGDRRDPRFGTVIPHPGWDLDAAFGAPVRAPFEGRVAYADWFRGYGLVVVVDHGHGVHSVYAHLSSILVESGETVPPQTLLGRVGDTGSLRGAYLYMEIREEGKAVDPALWIDRK